MKFSIAALAVAALIGLCIAAPSSELEADAHLSTDLTSSLNTASDFGEESARAKKSAEQPKTLCVEMKNEEGTSFLQCADNGSDLAASATSYSAVSSGGYGGGASGGYGGGSSGGYGGGSSYSAPAPSYKVRKNLFSVITSVIDTRIFIAASGFIRWHVLWWFFKLRWRFILWRCRSILWRCFLL